MWDIALYKTIGHTTGQSIGQTMGSFCLDARLKTDAKRCVIIGGSGAGKTLLLKMIAGMIKPDKGHVSIAGQRLDQLDMAQRNVAYLFQDYALFPHLTVAQQVAFSTRRGWFNPSKRTRGDEQVAYWLEALGIAHLAAHYPWQLSGGQQQRTALARLLISKPDVLLFDEPFAALDTSLRDQMRRLVDEWQQRLDLPLLIITHDPDDAQVFGDDVWQMVRQDNRATLQRISSEENQGHAGRLQLLSTLAQHEDLTQVAKALNMTEDAVHHGIDALNNFAGTALVQRQPSKTCDFRLTQAGQQWLRDYQLATERQRRFIAHLPHQQQEVLMASYLQTSAHNELRGQISALEVGAINVQVTIVIGEGQMLTAIVSKSSVERLNLAQGMPVIALINASDVLLSTQSLTSVLSARNQLKGIVQRIEKGLVNDEIFIDLGDGSTLAAIITHESAKELAITVGQPIYALVKAPNVMLATLSSM